MPCESCHVQFTVFRRKRICGDCKRFYCSNCLTTNKRRTFNNAAHITSVGVQQLCGRCLIFAKRPLLRTDLQHLKPKDLIFYLQSKHISTTGCVEKEELVGLVLSHVHTVDADAASNNCGSDDGGSTCSYAEPAPNPLDSIKQTCQNFFTTITENISDSLNSFDNKGSPKTAGGGDARSETRSGRGSTDSSSLHIFDQPRVATREIPTYASFQQDTNHNNNNYNVPQPTRRSTLTTPTTTTPSTPLIPTTTYTGIGRNVATTSSTLVSSSSQSSTSPEISISSIDRALSAEPQFASTSNGQNSELLRQPVAIEISDCECSDDELIATFSERSLARKNNCDDSNKESVKNLIPDERLSNKSKTSTDINGAEISSHSSFEELGAIGGVSDESKAATDTNSSNMEQWQFLENSALQTPASPVTEQSLTVACVSSAVPSTSRNVLTDDTITDTSKDLQVAVLSRQQGQTPLQPSHPTVPQRIKKVIRRRSESYLNKLRQRPTSEDDSPTANIARTLHQQNTDIVENNAGETNSEAGKAGSGRRRIGNCQRCGKHKATLRKQVEKMRRHLESAQLSEEEIKKELQDFLSYLEQRSKSMECSDTETVGSSLSGRNYGQSPEHGQTQSIWEGASMAHWEYQLDDNEGIHVYAGSTSDMDCYNGQPSRFINLEDFENIDDLEGLSVKQLKEILMLNRVDYKGCCEKQELFDRVQRLWKNLKSATAVDKLATDELCKICMDAPIECVILECGHMATCTNCGKVLSECPICRQYIVRVVRFFRA